MKISSCFKVILTSAMVAASGSLMAQSSEAFNPTETFVSSPASAPAAPNGSLSPVIVSSGNLVTSPGTGAGGADESVLQNTSLGLSLLGFGHQVLNGNRMADEFTMPGPGRVEQITFYAYQTGSTTTSTMTAVNLRIWDGVPAAMGSTVIFGDTATNLLVSTEWSGIYRVTETTGGATNRPIMANTVSVGIDLAPGTYWLDWQTDGSLGSGPWAPPTSIVGQITTGNGLQSITDNGVTFADALDSGTNTPQGFPFEVRGSLVPQIIPTMNVWGIAVLVALMVGVMVLLRRKTTVS